MAPVARFVSPIAPPGSRLLRAPPLRFLNLRWLGDSRREFALPLVSLVDCLLCLVLFLLSSFAAPDGCPKQARVPSAENGRPSTDAPVVAVSRYEASVDGTPVADMPTLFAGGRLTRIQLLFEHLKAKRELWRELNPSGEFPGVVTLQVDRAVPALVVKNVFQTAAQAGYPSVAFSVWQR